MFQVANTYLARASTVIFARLRRVWGWCSPGLMWVLSATLG